VKYEDERAGVVRWEGGDWEGGEDGVSAVVGMGSEELLVMDVVLNVNSGSWAWTWFAGIVAG
jgi:hypothetical protein